MSPKKRELTLAPCGGRKTWDHNPNAPRLVPAGRAYVGNLSVLSRNYADEFAPEWVFISAKHGILDPGKRIANYNVKLDKAGVAPLARRLRKLDYLRQFDRINVLGGRLYVRAVTMAVESRKVRVYRLYPDGPRGMFDIQDALTRALKTGKRLRGTRVSSRDFKE
jgi:uncharacterized protein DUF6884